LKVGKPKVVLFFLSNSTQISSHVIIIVIYVSRCKTFSVAGQCQAKLVCDW